MTAIPQELRGACAGERGLTLVEMLVVLAIIGVMAGAVALSLGRGGADRAVETEARRLAGRLRLAADDVRLDERPLDFAWNAHGYAFGRWDATRRLLRPDALVALGKRDLPDGITIETDGTAGRAEDVAPIAPDGAGPPIALRMTGRGRAWTVRFDGLDAEATQVR